MSRISGSRRTILTLPPDPSSPSAKPAEGPAMAIRRWPPATTGLALAWVLVYAAMIADQWRFTLPSNPLWIGQVDAATANHFGALTARDFASGEAWRGITATFVHVSLLHLAINTLGLIQIGRILEDWYGSSLFLAIYVAIGGLGNALAVAGKFALGFGLDIPAAGGSSVLFGLVGLMLVAGWRMNTRFGDYMRRLMLKNLLIYGVGVGIVAHKFLDNFGHAGGAVAGAIVGLLDPALLRLDRTRIARSCGAMAMAILLASAAAQVRASRHLTREEQAVRAARELNEVRLAGGLYEKIWAVAQQRGPFRADPVALLRQVLGSVLDNLDRDALDLPPAADPARFRKWRELLASAVQHPPSAAERKEFLAIHQSLVEQISRATSPPPQQPPASRR